MEERTITLSFCAGVGAVTGANFLLDTGTRKILIDCGIEQGSHEADLRNREDFPYDPKTIDILLITHAHMDHIGRIPKLVKDGFKGIIYSTPATYELAHYMLQDAVRLIDEEARREGILPMYEQKDVDATWPLWKTAEYYSYTDIGEDLKVYIKDSGHILGAAMFEISRTGGEKKIVFTGDLGNSPALFLRDTDSIKGATYMVMESVYGDRNHESKDDRRAKLTKIITETINEKRTLVIPTFSLERTQDILYEINELVETHSIATIPVYIDSPLATAVTHVYEKYTKDFKDSAQAQIAKGDDLFNFKKLRFVQDKQESMSLNSAAAPKIILAGSGMSNGGRVVDHEQYFLQEKDATILLVGYQSAGTLGRKILDGAKELIIHGQKIHVKAKVDSIMGYSSHKDSDHLVDFVAEAHETLKNVFVVMGEMKSALFLTQRLRDYVGVNATAPKRGDTVKITI